MVPIGPPDIIRIGFSSNNHPFRGRGKFYSEKCDTKSAVSERVKSPPKSSSYTNIFDFTLYWTSEIIHIENPVFNPLKEEEEEDLPEDLQIDDQDTEEGTAQFRQGELSIT